MFSLDYNDLKRLRWYCNKWDAGHGTYFEKYKSEWTMCQPLVEHGFLTLIDSGKNDAIGNITEKGYKLMIFIEILRENMRNVLEF